MNDQIWDEAVQKGMADPIDRKIITSLWKENMSLSQIQCVIIDEGNHDKISSHLQALKEFIEFDIEQSKYGLTYRGELLAKIMDDFRGRISSVPNYVGYAQGLKGGDHACTLYKDNFFRRHVTFPFIESGLMRGYAGAYFTSEQILDSDVKAIREYGVDFDSLPKEAFTVMSSEDWYLKKGKADPETMKSNLSRLVQEKKDAGFVGLVIAGESGVLIENGFTEECIKYEEIAGRQFSSDLYAICLYNQKKLSGVSSNRLFKCHGHVIIRDLVGKTRYT
jgi:hypothetical protein